MRHLAYSLSFRLRLGVFDLQSIRQRSRGIPQEEANRRICRDSYSHPSKQEQKHEREEFIIVRIYG